MFTEIGAEQNTTTIIMMPSEFVSAARGMATLADNLAGGASGVDRNTERYATAPNHDRQAG